jgi:hypothetical protein
MSKNRQQLKTGLRAILGGGLREEPVAPENRESEYTPAASVIEPELTGAVVDSLPLVEEKETPAVHLRVADVDEVWVDESPVVAVPVEEPARKPRKKPTAPLPSPQPLESKPNMASLVRVGTLENPYVRKRDNLPTRKVGIVLPVALAERMQIHCVKARTRPNEFVARAIEALLDELQA